MAFTYHSWHRLVGSRPDLERLRAGTRNPDIREITAPLNRVHVSPDGMLIHIFLFAVIGAIGAHSACPTGIDFVTRLLQKSPTYRMTVKNAQTHAWLVLKAPPSQAAASSRTRASVLPKAGKSVCMRL